MNPDDAAALGLRNGDMVRVRSRRGFLDVPCNITKRVNPGVTFMTFHFTETPANVLTNSASDPVSQTPEFKICAVRAYKVVRVDKLDPDADARAGRHVDRAAPDPVAVRDHGDGPAHSKR
jgi:predicted molibdopterin-dependent oxidoreductase YjgC